MHKQLGQRPLSLDGVWNIEEDKIYESPIMMANEVNAELRQ